jgi:branched-chain amino acid transport system substrate-binding protein
MHLNILGKDIFILFITILCLPACAVSEIVNAPRTVKIGLVAPFEGSHRPLGYEALFGVKLALQERNSGGGLDGYQVELVALNDFDEPSEAAVQARALLVDPDILGVVGHLSSATTLAAVPLYQEAGLAVVIPWSVAPEWEMEQGGVVSVAADTTETGARLETMSREMGLNYMTELAGPNFDLITADTQAIALATEGLTAGEIVVNLRQANISLPVLGYVEVGSPQTVQVAEAAANGLIFVSPGPDPRQMVEAASFVEAYQALAGFSPGPRAVLAYDATQILLDGIEQSLRINDSFLPTRAHVSTVIKTVQRAGLSGDIAFDQQGQRVNAPIWIYRIVDGVYPGVLLSP